jgi:serine/threonine protein kinase
VQARYADLVRRNEAAARSVAAEEALLASARAEIERVLAGYAGGLFTGATIGGYRVERLLGRGGMGEVYAAQRDGARVALKIIRADRLADAAVRKRFAGEADVLRRVASPYVARVLDVGTEDDRLPYLVMELVEGVSLADQLRGGGTLGPEAVHAMVRDVARGLGDCHRAEIVHRDVKPHNLVLTTVDGAPRWKLVDFGIAQVAGAARATTGRVIVGTPAYMAPEQLAGQAADARSDLYSLCLVVFRVLAGRPAFTAARVGDAHARPPDLDGIAELPRDLRHVLRIGLADVPADRFASAAELEAAFAAAFAGALDDEVRLRSRALRDRDPWA